MIARLANYDDLFAYDAKYHKTCYSKYISLKNVTAKIRQKPDITCPPDKADNVMPGSSDEEFSQGTSSKSL